MTDLNNTAKRTINPEQWVDLYADYLFSFAFSRIHDSDLAKDLVQETFLAALQKAATFQGRSSERSWLTAILKYKIIDIYRKSAADESEILSLSRALGQQQGFFEPVSGHWNPGHFPELLGVEDNDPHLNTELAQILNRCMEKLPSLWFSVFTLKHIEELSTDIICDRLQITPSNFWVCVHRAKVNLRACLQKNWL